MAAGGHGSALDDDAIGDGMARMPRGLSAGWVQATPNSLSAARFGTAFYYRLLTSAGRATNYFGGTRACHRSKLLAPKRVSSFSHCVGIAEKWGNCRLIVALLGRAGST